MSGNAQYRTASGNTGYQTASGNTEYQIASGKTEYQTPPKSIKYRTVNSTKTKTKLPALSVVDPSPKSLASSTQRKTTTKRSLSLEKEEEPKGDTPRTMQRQALAEAITTAMSKALEPLLAANET